MEKYSLKSVVKTASKRSQKISKTEAIFGLLFGLLFITFCAVQALNNTGYNNTYLDGNIIIMFLIITCGILDILFSITRIKKKAMYGTLFLGVLEFIIATFIILLHDYVLLICGIWILLRGIMPLLDINKYQNKVSTVVKSIINIGVGNLIIIIIFYYSVAHDLLYNVSNLVYNYLPVIFFNLGTSYIILSIFEFKSVFNNSQKLELLEMVASDKELINELVNYNEYYEIQMKKEEEKLAIEQEEKRKKELEKESEQKKIKQDEIKIEEQEIKQEEIKTEEEIVNTEKTIETSKESDLESKDNDLTEK